ncbi:pentapeptide repeat-containing protein [Chamaesiphon sp. VAR_48_metabat_135_sub]|uniref:pentapeptide repeat-containing protein n=1 Tax=Chamaesiphon sp. VAR_48_metabat_135_sub TaxID=2964699 RepID=UPI0037BE6C78
MERSFLADVKMNGAIIRNANLRETYLQFFIWSDVDFTGSDFSVSVDYDSSLTCSSWFRRCNFTDTIWANTYLDEVNFVECNFTNVNFINVGCLNVTFSRCIFTGASKDGLYNDWSFGNRFIDFIDE